MASAISVFILMVGVPSKVVLLCLNGFNLNFGWNTASKFVVHHGPAGDDKVNAVTLFDLNIVCVRLSCVSSHVPASEFFAKAFPRVLRILCSTPYDNACDSIPRIFVVPIVKLRVEFSSCSS